MQSVKMDLNLVSNDTIIIIVKHKRFKGRNSCNLNIIKMRRVILVQCILAARVAQFSCSGLRKYKRDVLLEVGFYFGAREYFICNQNQGICSKRGRLSYIVN